MHSETCTNCEKIVQNDPTKKPAHQFCCAGCSDYESGVCTLLKKGGLREILLKETPCRENVETKLRHIAEDMTPKVRDKDFGLDEEYRELLGEITEFQVLNRIKTVLERVKDFKNPTLGAIFEYANSTEDEVVRYLTLDIKQSKRCSTCLHSFPTEKEKKENPRKIYDEDGNRRCRLANSPPNTPDSSFYGESVVIYKPLLSTCEVRDDSNKKHSSRVDVCKFVIKCKPTEAGVKWFCINENCRYYKEEKDRIVYLDRTPESINCAPKNHKFKPTKVENFSDSLKGFIKELKQSYLGSKLLELAETEPKDLLKYLGLKDDIFKDDMKKKELAFVKKELKLALENKLKNNLEIVKIEMLSEIIFRLLCKEEREHFFARVGRGILRFFKFVELRNEEENGK